MGPFAANQSEHASSKCKQPQILISPFYKKKKKKFSLTNVNMHLQSAYPIFVILKKIARSLFTNHILYNQIKFSFDLFLKKIDLCVDFPPTNKEIFGNCLVWNWAQFYKEITHLFLERRWEHAHYHWIE